MVTSLEERIAYLEALLRRTQEFVGTETQAGLAMNWTLMTTTGSLRDRPQTQSENLRKEAEKLERQDALIVELREALKQSTAAR